MSADIIEIGCLPTEVWEGAGGHIILCQEFPGTEGEHYVRVFISTDDAERVCSEIMATAKRLRRGS